MNMANLIRSSHKRTDHEIHCLIYRNTCPPEYLWLNGKGSDTKMETCRLQRRQAKVGILSIRHRTWTRDDLPTHFPRISVSVSLRFEHILFVYTSGIEASRRGGPFGLDKLGIAYL